MKQKLRSNLCLVIPPLLTIAILLLTFVIKGVYPFGESNVSYYDMNQAYVSLYARNYEIFHGQESLIYDWFEGAGSDMTSTYPEISLHPINWVFFFLKPEYVLHFMALFLLIKLVITSFNISLYLKKVFVIPLPMQVALSMIYTFSGYLLQFYTNTFFVDSMVFLPILMLALRHMFSKGSGLPYLLALFFELVTQPYLGIMTLIFILFYAFCYTFTLKDKEAKRTLSAKVGLYTFTAIALSMVTFLPAVMKWTTTKRITNNNENSYTLMEIFKMSFSDFDVQKKFLPFNTEIVLVMLVIVLLSAIKKRKKLPGNSMFYICIYLLMLIPIYNEGVLLLWQLGSYMHFPYRNGYMFSFVAVELAAHLLMMYNDKDITQKTEDRKSWYVLLSICGISVITGFWKLIEMSLTFVDYGIHESRASYYNTPLIFRCFTLAYLIMLFIPKKTRQQLFLWITVLKTAVTSVCFIAPLSYSDTSLRVYYTTRDKFIGDTLELRDNAGLENDNISRVKLLYPALSRNYPILLRYPSINQWTGEAGGIISQELDDLGYAAEWTANYDFGGTVFSDALLNNKKLIVYGDPYVPEELYTKTCQVGEYSVYDINYTLPFGMLCDERILDTDKTDEEDILLSHQIKIANALSDSDSPIFRELPSAEPDDELLYADNEDTVFSYDLTADCHCILYAQMYDENNIKVNGERIVLPYFEELDNTEIRDPKSKILFAGCFEKGDKITLSAESTLKQGDQNKYVFLDLNNMKKLQEKYENSCASSYEAGKNSLSITADVKGNNYMFLPVTYSADWHAVVNGAEAEVLPVMNGAFMAVKLPDGHCEISMKYMPRLIIYGAVISLAGLMFSLVLLISHRLHKDITELPAVGKLAYPVFTLVTASFFVFMYVLPIIIR